MLIRVLVLVLVGLALPQVASAAAADPRPIQVTSTTNRYFSPNGDGRRDQLTVHFLLRDRATVTVLVRDQTKNRAVRQVRLGALPGGEHVWHWDGRDGAGRPAPNGPYRIRITAAGESRTGIARVRAGLDRGGQLEKARVWLSRNTVYPRTTEFVDRIYIRSTQGPVRTDLEIRDADGHVVRQIRVHAWANWAAREDSGDLLPPGEYDATFTMRDPYGNRRTTHRTLTISDQPLHAEIWSTTVRAADADLVVGSLECAPIPSQRFDGGMTVTPGECDSSVFRPRVDEPFRLDPSSSWRVSVTGGSTTPGEPDAGVISLRADPAVPEIVTAPGDGTTTTPWGQVPYYEWALPRDWPFWLAVRDPDVSYDVASFTLEVRRWVP